MKSDSGSITCDELCALAVDWGESGPGGPEGEGEEVAAARAHLAGCTACRRLLEAQGEALRRLRPLAAACPPEAPPALQARLAEALDARRASRARGRRRIVIAGLAASALTAGAAGYLLLPRDQIPVPPVAETVATGTAPSETTRHLQPPGVPGRADPARRYRPLGWLEQERPLEAGRVARVELRAEMAASFGWPLVPHQRGGRVQADILYGEDGLARAVRFIPTSFRIDAEEGTSP